MKLPMANTLSSALQKLTEYCLNPEHPIGKSQRRVGTEVVFLLCPQIGDPNMMDVLAVVAILKDVPEQGIVRGQVGTIVEKLAPAMWEVEFSGTDGQTYALVEAQTEDLMTLQFEPLQKAA